MDRTAVCVVLCVLWTLPGLQGDSAARYTSAALEISNANNEEVSCIFGGAEMPLEVFKIFAGWRCYEESYGGEDTPVRMFICSAVTDRGTAFNVPCFQFGGNMVSFDLGDEQTVTKLRIQERENSTRKSVMKCFEEDVAACRERVPHDVKLLDDSVAMVTTVEDNSDRIKFFISMLSISLIIGTPAAIILVYYGWKSTSRLLGYHRNTLAALVFRSFFTLLIQTEVMMDGSSPLLKNGSGCKALAFFEVLSRNMFLVFWMNTTLYIHRHAQGGFDKEPKVKKSNYAIASLALVMSIVWVIVTAVAHDTDCWQGGERSWLEWVRVGVLALQLALLCNVVRLLATKLRAVHDDTARKMRHATLFSFILTLLFVVQFSLNAAAPPSGTQDNPYFYTMYFFDGLQCTFTAILFCYFDPSVHSLVKETFGIPPKPSSQPNYGNNERTITTIDSLHERAPRDNRRVEEEDSENRKDIIYSSVVGPQKFQRTIGLMNRLNVAPQASISLVEGEAYVDCDASAADRKISLISQYYDAESVDEFRVSTTSLNVFHEVDAPSHHIDRSSTDMEPEKPKYKSKYLVHDSETVSTASEDSVIETPKNRASSNSEYSTTSVPDIMRGRKAPIITVQEPSIRRAKERMLVEVFTESTAEDVGKAFQENETSGSETETEEVTAREMPNGPPSSSDDEEWSRTRGKFVNVPLNDPPENIEPLTYDLRRGNWQTLFGDNDVEIRKDTTINDPSKQIKSEKIRNDSSSESSSSDCEQKRPEVVPSMATPANDVKRKLFSFESDSSDGDKRTPKPVSSPAWKANRKESDSETNSSDEEVEVGKHVKEQTPTENQETSPGHPYDELMSVGRTARGSESGTSDDEQNLELAEQKKPRKSVLDEVEEHLRQKYKEEMMDPDPKPETSPPQEVGARPIPRTRTFSGKGLTNPHEDAQGILNPLPRAQENTDQDVRQMVRVASSSSESEEEKAEDEETTTTTTDKKEILKPDEGEKKWNSVSESSETSFPAAEVHLQEKKVSTSSADFEVEKVNDLPGFKEKKVSTSSSEFEVEKVKVDGEDTETSEDEQNSSALVDDYYRKLLSVVRPAEATPEVKMCVPAEENASSHSEEEVELKPAKLPDIYDDLKAYTPRKPQRSYGDKQAAYSGMWLKYRDKLISNKKGDEPERGNSWPSSESVKKAPEMDRAVAALLSPKYDSHPPKMIWDEDGPGGLKKATGMMDVRSGSATSSSSSSDSDSSEEERKRAVTKTAPTAAPVRTDAALDWEPQRVHY